MRALAILVALTGLAACSGEADTNGGSGAEAGAVAGAMADAAGSVTGIVTSDAPAGDAPIIATRAEVEQAWKCDGLLTAAYAARTMIKEGLPDEVAAITSDKAMYWTTRAARLRAPDMTEAELDALTASSVRVLATPQAIENALPDIRACLAAQGAG